MICMTSFCRKVFSGLMVIMLCAAPAFSSDAISGLCIDINSSSPPITSRVVELAATPVNEKYFSLAGALRNQAGDVVGTAGGTAVLTGDNVIATVNTAFADGLTVETTIYLFNFDISTFLGDFKGITQKYIDENSVLLNFKSGDAALVACNAPLTHFIP